MKRKDKNASLANMKILVVEDNELNLKLFHDLLVIKDFEVISIKDGSQVLEAALKHSPNLILMDIQLNGMSGLKIIKQIKDHPKIAEVPIVAVTAFAMKDDKEKIMKSGCQAYMAKPVSIDQFYKVIGQFVPIK
jgi:two-component system cell cycle response regulator DivK